MIEDLLPKNFFKRANIAFPILFCVYSTVSAGEFFNAQTLGAGGVGVAGADFNNSSLLNPALVNVYSPDDKASINASIGIIASDEDEILENAEDLEDELDDIDDSIPSRSEGEDIVDLLQDLDGAEADFEFGSYFQVTLPNQYGSFAFFINFISDTAVTTDIDDADITALNAAVNTAVFDSDTVNSEIFVLNSSIAEYGVTLAKSFDLQGANISIGISPKFQDIDIYDYIETVDRYDEDDFDSRRNRSSDSHFNANIGLHASIADAFFLGVVVADISEEEFDTKENRLLDMETRTTAGFAYKTGENFVELNLDLDAAKDFASQQETQMLRVGTQVDLVKWAKLRFGYRHDLEDNKEDLLTFGFGFRPTGIMNIDVAGVLGEDNTYGGIVQFGFNFQ